MRRRHWFELHDQEWFPGPLRDGITECLRVYSEQLRFEAIIAPLMQDVLRETGQTKIVDLCSGACGPVVPLSRELERAGAGAHITVTDKYPNTVAFARAEIVSRGAVRGWRVPVDATCVPGHLSGVRTLFNAFHHFRPEQARAMLEDAYAKGQPIVVFEITHRSLPRAVVTFLGSALTMFLLVPRMHPWRPVWWIFTYVLPILPLAFGWDGMVSCLRTYSEEDYRTLTAGLTDGYLWRYDRRKVAGIPLHIACLVGTPAAERVAVA